MIKPISVVTIGGGSGQYVLLSALRDLERLAITAVVSMSDSGGSTGRLRDEFGILPPGDILKCVLALSPHREIARELLLKRFASSKRLAGHNAGNMLLTMLSQYAGSFPAGIRALAEMLDARGEILPVTTDKVTLVAELTNGERVFGESAIDIPGAGRREKIASVFLVPHHIDSISVYPSVLEKIAAADAVLIGPGDLYTSILPNLLVPGVREALQSTSARILYIANIMTKFGETDGYHVEDFVEEIECHVGRAVDNVICNNRWPPKYILQRYAMQNARPVQFRDFSEAQRRFHLLCNDFLDTDGDIVRHNSESLATTLQRELSLRVKFESSAVAAGKRTIR